MFFKVYTYYAGGIKERIARYRYTGEGLSEPYTLIEDIPGARNHDGSRLLFDDNHKLYVTTGDAQNANSSQDLNSLNGKVLRMNTDGSIPSDNPFPDSYVWSWGHRNAQGLIIGENGLMYSSEHGPNNDDELNLIVKGGNYGWPQVHGFCDSPSEIAFCQENDIIEPLYAWTPTLAVAGIDYYNSDLIPQWKNSILMTNLKASELTSLTLDPSGQEIRGVETWFDGWFGRLRDLCISPDGRVFIAVSNRDGRGSPKVGDDRIIQISPAE